MINRIRNTRAFTLVELIAVIIILGVLATAAFAGFRAVINDSRVETVQASLASLDNEAQAIRAFSPELSADELTADEGEKLTELDLAEFVEDFEYVDDAGAVATVGTDVLAGAYANVAQIGGADVCVSLELGDEVRANGEIEREGTSCPTPTP